MRLVIKISVVCLTTFTLPALAFLSCYPRPYQVLFGYKQVDYQFPSAEVRKQLINSGEFIPENNLFAGIKIFGERIFLAVPRWRLGVPSTLNFIKFDKSQKRKELEVNGNGDEALSAPPLEPYPSWEMQKVGDCSALQFCQSMEIDEFGRLWVFDAGRINIIAEDPADHQNLCPAKLIIFDLATDKLILNYEFPSEVVSPTSNFLNDITVGCDSFKRNNCWAYLSESGDGKIIIFNLEEKRSWYVRHNRTMDLDPEALIIPISGINYTIPGKVNGVTLSPKDSNHDRLYYAPLTTYAMYSVSSAILQTATNGHILQDSDLTVHTTNRSSQSGGIIMDSEGILFYGAMQNNSVVCVDTQDPDGFSKETEMIESDEDLQWPDSFAFDNERYLYTNPVRVHRFLTNTLDWNEVNFRILRSYVGSRSYVYSSGRKNN